MKGENLMIFVKQDDLLGNGSSALMAFGMATSCELNVTVDEFDATSKDGGSWKAPEPGMKGWSMSTSNLYTPHADKLLMLQIARKKIKLYWIPSENTETNNETSHTPALSVDGETYKFYSGYAWINNYQSTANHNETANYTVNFTGTGPLTPSDSLPTNGIGVDRSQIHIGAGGSEQVVVSNATGTISATCSYTGITCTVSNGVVTIAAASDISAGATHVLISDSGTSTSCYVSVVVSASSIPN